MGEDDELMTKHFERWQKFGNAEIRNTKYGNTEMPKYTVNIYRCPPERYRRSKIQQQMQADDRTRSSSHPIIPGSTSENTVPGKPFLVGREKWKNGTKERIMQPTTKLIPSSQGFHFPPFHFHLTEDWRGQYLYYRTSNLYSMRLVSQHTYWIVSTSLQLDISQDTVRSLG